MKLTSLFKGVEKTTIKLTKKQLFSVRGKDVHIHCLYGDLWITWPKRGEEILKGGQTFRVSSKGKVCIVALSNAFFQMSKRKWYDDTQPMGNREQKTEIPIFFRFLLKLYYIVGYKLRGKRANRRIMYTS